MTISQKRLAVLLSSIIVLGVAVGLLAQRFVNTELQWSEEELATLKLMTINEQASMPAVNHELAKLGQLVFFDTDFSSNGEVSCASCHQPDKFFTDGEAISSSGVGTPDRHTPTIIGISESPWLFWDGRKDSLWSQALGPLESPVEHGSNRTHYVQTFISKYASPYQKLFGPIPNLVDLPDHATPAGNNEEWQKNWQDMSQEQKNKVNQVFVNLGFAIAEYEKLMQPAPAKFDEFATALVAGEDTHHLYNSSEKGGLKLFLDADKTGCINCHNGSNFTNHDFQSTGVPDVTRSFTFWDKGRASGILQARADEFNCYSQYQDADCSELTYARADDFIILGAMKVPTLRNISETAPYMHRGQFKDLDEVLTYYNKAVPVSGRHVEIMPLRLLPHELKQLKAFLLTLTAPLSVDKSWLDNPHSADSV